MARGDSRRKSRGRGRSVSRKKSASRGRSPAGPAYGYKGGAPDKEEGETNTIFAAQLAGSVKERHLEDLFNDAGFPVKSAFIVLDRFNDQSKGYAFIELKDSRDVKAACDKLSGTELGGRSMKCEPRQPRPEAARARAQERSRERRDRDGDRGGRRSRSRGGRRSRSRGGRRSRSRRDRSRSRRR